MSAMRPAFVLDARSAYMAGKEARLPDLPWVIGFTDMAAAGGALVPGDEIRAIERIPVSQLMQGVDGQILPGAYPCPYRPHGAASQLSTGRCSGAGHVRSVDVPARALCPGLTIVKQGRRGDAFSDLHNVAITTGLLDKLGSDDAVAFIIGHELAHTIFADSRKGSLSRRDKESRADLYGAHIAACAGFDPGKAMEALAVVRSMNVGGLSLTHRPYKVRQQAIARYLSVRPDCQAAFGIEPGGEMMSQDLFLRAGVVAAGAACGPVLVARACASVAPAERIAPPCRRRGGGPAGRPALAACLSGCACCAHLCGGVRGADRR